MRGGTGADAQGLPLVPSIITESVMSGSAELKVSVTGYDEKLNTMTSRPGNAFAWAMADRNDPGAPSRTVLTVKVAAELFVSMKAVSSMATNKQRSPNAVKSFVFTNVLNWFAASGALGGRFLHRCTDTFDEDCYWAVVRISAWEGQSRSNAVNCLRIARKSQSWISVSNVAAPKVSPSELNATIPIFFGNGACNVASFSPVAALTSCTRFTSEHSAIIRPSGENAARPTNSPAECRGISQTRRHVPISHSA